MFSYIDFKNFRNIEDGVINTNSSSIIFMGENGQGKTNILESVYMLCYGTSFRTKKNKIIVKNGFSYMSISGDYKNNNSISIPVSIILKDGKKSIFFNNKKTESMESLFDNFPCIVFANDDINFVNGEPVFQRKFIDQMIVLYDPLFIYKLREYKKLLESRNKLIKENNIKLLDIYDKKLSVLGSFISSKREWFINYVKNDFSNIMSDLTGKEVKIKFLSSYKSFSVDDIFEYYINNRKKDFSIGYTSVGSHRDRVFFEYEDKNFVSYASTGQIRTIALVLRILQARFLFYVSKKKPILLMDDVLLELDPCRRKKLLSLLPEFSQIFFTFLPDEPAMNYLNIKNSIVYSVKGGRVFIA
ncbi:DNA replication and repair protein RecF [Spirochaetia bacterium 38H-sp]|uniref:DNA replication and repair protein RecF n=1 Tax=Rarispira pelagica TaxID=3141764 RepID=A0ABU9U988_9SPIR